MNNLKYDKFLSKLKDIKPFEIKYNFLDVIGKIDDENIISNWLAFLLNSDKSGCSKLLENLASYLDLEIEGRQLKVEREYYLDNKKRIDIVIKTENAWLVIENKINSFEGNEQTNDYFSFVQKEIAGKSTQVKYLYLKPEYNKSKPSNKNFHEITYNQLFFLWKNIKKSDFETNMNYIYFLEFMKLIKEKYIVEQEIKFDKEALIFLEYKSQINELEKAYQNACMLVNSKLISSLKEIFLENDGWIIRPHFSWEWIQIRKKEWVDGTHYEIGTWNWQKKSKNISFERLINKDVEIQYCLHAEGKQSQHIKEIVKEFETDKILFCVQHYDFSDEQKCLDSIKLIIKHLNLINEHYTAKIDLLCK